MSVSQPQFEKEISTTKDTYSVLVKFDTGKAATDQAAPGKVNGDVTIAELVKEVARVATVDEKEVTIHLIANFPRAVTTSRDDYPGKSCSDVVSATYDEIPEGGTSSSDKSAGGESSSKDESQVQDEDEFEVISADGA